MTSVKAFRSFFAVILSCMITWISLSSPAFAAGDPVGSFIDGFWSTFGNIVGGATGAVVVCYTVDVVIAPVAPPIAAYMAPMCPAIGGLSGWAGTNAVLGAH